MAAAGGVNGTDFDAVRGELRRLPARTPAT
jgi:hypothetical protein